MHRRIVLFLPLAMIAFTGSLLGQANTSQGAIVGTVAYPQHATLPLDAVVAVRLEDMSLTDAQARLVSESVVSAAGHEEPFPFTLSYDPAAINPSHTYQVLATVTANGTLLFTSKARRVLTRGAPASVAILLQQIVVAAEPLPSTTTHTVPSAALPAPPRATPAPLSVIPLQETRWKPIHLGGEPLVASPGTSAPWIVLHKEQNKYTGWTGCGDMFGTYTLTQNALQFSRPEANGVVCTPEMTRQELAFAVALRATRGYRITGDTLELLLGDEVVGVFRALKK